MSNPEQTLVEFGREMGINHLCLGPRGTVELRLESGSTLGLALNDERDGELVVYLAVPATDHDRAARLLRAMKFAASPKPGAPALQVGWYGRGDNEVLVLAARLNDADCSVHALRQTVKELHDAYARIADMP